jgi:hypothetical protein
MTSIVPYGYYQTIKQFVTAVKTDINGDILLTYNEVSRKNTVKIKLPMFFKIFTAYV